MFRRTICSAAAIAATLLAGASSAGAAVQQPLSIMRVPEALDLVGRPLTEVPVLVADTGLDLQHPGIAPRLLALPGLDMLGTDQPGELRPDSDPDDPAGGSGHGTAVAGVLGNVAPNARFVALRTCWDGDECYQYVQAAAIDWAAERGAKVASFSWLSGPLEDGLRDAITAHPEMLFVAIPSGNGGATNADGEDPQPCGLQAANVLCVSTSSPQDDLDCGAFGPASVDVAVPTQNSVTTLNGGGFGPTSCATSFAAPAAAGVATILFGIDPSAQAADVRAAIVDSARRVPAWAGKSVSGGIVDAAAAVRLFQQRRGLPTATAPPATTPPAPSGAGTARVSPLTLTVAPAKRSARYLVRFTARTSERARLSLAVQRRVAGRWTTTTTTTTGARTTHTVTVSARRASGARRAAGTYRVRVTALGSGGTQSSTRTIAVGAFR